MDEDPTPHGGAGQGERVAKALARAGVASRREVERLIAAGRVTLNGVRLTTPAVKVGAGDVLAVDGRTVAAAEPPRLWRYHKPAGLVTTHRDPQGRPTVFERLPKSLPRVISIGRLDLNSEGLLLLTNDGALARAMELPSSGLVRRYRARARGLVTQAALDRLREGLTVDGVRYGPIQARLEAKTGEGVNRWISVELAEGKNREVRKVLEAVGLTVNRLIRTQYGPHRLGDLKPGEVEEVGAAAPPKPRAERAPAKVYKAGWARPKPRATPKPKPTGARPAKSSPARRRGPGPGGDRGRRG